MIESFKLLNEMKKTTVLFMSHDVGDIESLARRNHPLFRAPGRDRILFPEPPGMGKEGQAMGRHGNVGGA
jgi:hypothetical protein